VLEVPITGVEVAGGRTVPRDATAVVANVTATNPAADGYLTVFPCGDSPPNASNLNFVAGQTVANLVFATVGTEGEVCLISSVATDVIVDLQGWYQPG
jgi:hypothetical protein